MVMAHPERVKQWSVRPIVTAVVVVVGIGSVVMKGKEKRKRKRDES
jgi:hypothetical protein